MKVLIDATNIKFGGGVQVAISVIKRLQELKLDNLNFVYVINSNIAKQLDFNSDSEVFTIDTGIKTLIPFASEKKILKEIENKVDVTFSIFGPCFWYPKKSTHLIGFANAWLVSPDSIAYTKLAYPKRYFLKFKNFILGKFLFRQNAYYVTETDSVKTRFLKYFRAEDKNIFVVPNTLPYVYNIDSNFTTFPLPIEFSKKIKLVSITHNYPHKNLSIIEEVGEILSSKGLDFIFIVTFDEVSYEKMSTSFKKYTYNVGPISVIDCPNLYRACDALFLPTLIECFTVSYLEAMFHEIPILTSDLEFAHEICDDFGFYFNPLEPVDIANKILQVAVSDSRNDQFTTKGKKKVTHHIGNTEKVDLYLNLIKRISEV